MAEFTTAPSWLVTARFLGHLLLPGRVPVKGFPELTAREWRELAIPLVVFRTLVAALAAVFLILVGLIMMISFFGALFALFVFFVGGPVLIVTILWFGLKIIVGDGK